MKKYIKKEYILLAFIFISILSTVIINPIGNLDEIWNYNTARNITLGKIPYKEINTITTPLMPMVNALFLKVFGDQVLTMRIVGVAISTLIIFMIFKIMKHLSNETNISAITALAIGILFKDLYCLDYYNFMTLLIGLIILYHELKEPHNTFKNIILGILAGLAICTKQTTGTFIAIVAAISPIIRIKSKQDIKNTVKQIVSRILGISIPCILFLLYLVITNSFMDFINYAVQGISTFNNNIPYTFLLQIPKMQIKTLSIIMPISVIILILTSVISYIKHSQKQELKNIQILTLYSLPMLIMIYPIADEIHFLMGTTLFMVVTTYLLFVILKWIYSKIDNKNKLFIYKTTTLTICVFFELLISVYAITNFTLYTNKYLDGKINQEIAHYKNIEVPEFIQERIEEISEYVKAKEQEGKEIYILDAEAALYRIPLNKYTKDYDMLLNGNIGKDGQNGIIERIKNEQNCIYLIKKGEYPLNWQTPMEVINYVRNNLEKTGEINIFNEYTNK